MFEATVVGLGGTVGCAGSIEVDQHVAGSLLQGPPEGDDFRQGTGDALAQRLDELGHQGAARLAVGLAVGRDHLLIDAPGDLDLDVTLDGEQCLEPVVLALGEQVDAGVQHAPCPLGKR